MNTTGLETPDDGCGSNAPVHCFLKPKFEMHFLIVPSGLANDRNGRSSGHSWPFRLQPARGKSLTRKPSQILKSMRMMRRVRVGSARRCWRCWCCTRALDFC